MSHKKTPAKPDHQTESPFKEHALLGEIQTDLKTYYKVRVISSEKKGAMLDIRQHITTERYTGYTQKGVSLPIDQVEELVDMLTEGQGGLTLRDLASMVKAPKSKKATNK